MILLTAATISDAREKGNERNTNIQMKRGQEMERGREREREQN